MVFSPLFKATFGILRVQGPYGPGREIKRGALSAQQIMSLSFSLLVATAICILAQDLCFYTYDTHVLEHSMGFKRRADICKYLVLAHWDGGGHVSLHFRIQHSHWPLAIDCQLAGGFSTEAAPMQYSTCSFWYTHRVSSPASILSRLGAEGGWGNDCFFSHIAHSSTSVPADNTILAGWRTSCH
jgi:hypothetical protein